MRFMVIGLLSNIKRGTKIERNRKIISVINGIHKGNDLRGNVAGSSLHGVGNVLMRWGHMGMMWGPQRSRPTRP